MRLFRVEKALDKKAANFTAVVVIGGAGSKATDWAFDQGAITSAFRYLFNNEILAKLGAGYTRLVATRSCNFAEELLVAGVGLSKPADAALAAKSLRSFDVFKQAFGRVSTDWTYP
jgi:hypothetical protein